MTYLVQHNEEKTYAYVDDIYGSGRSVWHYTLKEAIKSMQEEKRISTEEWLLVRKTKNLEETFQKWDVAILAKYENILSYEEILNSNPELFI